MIGNKKSDKKQKGKGRSHFGYAAGSKSHVPHRAGKASSKRGAHSTKNKEA